MTAPRDPIEAPQDAIRELIRVSKSAGMNAASDFGYLPSQQQADEQEISGAVQSVYAAIEAAARDEGRREAVREIRHRIVTETDPGESGGRILAILALLARHGRSSDPEPAPPGPVRFDLDEAFWLDWWKNWYLYGTVYAINNPEPRVVPADTLTIHEGPCGAVPALQATGEPSDE